MKYGTTEACWLSRRAVLGIQFLSELKPVGFWRQVSFRPHHRFDRRNRIPLQPVVHEDKSLPLRSCNLPFLNQLASSRSCLRILLFNLVIRLERLHCFFVLAAGLLPGVPAIGPDPGPMGRPEIQEAPRSSTPCRALVTASLNARPQAVGALGNRSQSGGFMMGAG